MKEKGKKALKNTFKPVNEAVEGGGVKIWVAENRSRETVVSVWDQGTSKKVGGMSRGSDPRRDLGRAFRENAVGEGTPLIYSEFTKGKIPEGANRLEGSGN